MLPSSLHFPPLWAGNSNFDSPPPPRGAASSLFQLRAGRLRSRHALHLAQVRDKHFFGALAVPVVVFGAAQSENVLDDGVLTADGDVPVAAGTAIELLSEAADQPDLIALVIATAQAPALAGEAGALVHRFESQAKLAAIAMFATPARRRAALDPGRLSAGDSAHSASVAISVPRSQASAHQSRCSPRRSAIRCAAAKVSQIGPQRRNRGRSEEHTAELQSHSY